MSKCVAWGAVTPSSSTWTDLRVCPITYDDGSKTFYVNGKTVKVAILSNVLSTKIFYGNSKAVSIALMKTPVSTKTFYGNGKTVQLRRLR